MMAPDSRSFTIRSRSPASSIYLLCFSAIFFNLFAPTVQEMYEQKPLSALYQHLWSWLLTYWHGESFQFRAFTEDEVCPAMHGIYSNSDGHDNIDITLEHSDDNSH
ncbi:hypothetical protein GQX74_009356 [Glossina fuscipes]|nr:hypothetical protein GQX74_009356 [Glossina fuscipes]